MNADFKKYKEETERTHHEEHEGENKETERKIISTDYTDEHRFRK